MASNPVGAVCEQPVGYFDAKKAPSVHAHAVWGAQSPIGIYMVWAPAHLDGPSHGPSMALVV